MAERPAPERRRDSVINFAWSSLSNQLDPAQYQRMISD